MGIVGIGAVGAACAYSIVARGSCRELVLVNRTRERAAGAAVDMRYGQPLGAPVDVADGDYDDLDGADVILLAAGVNEQSGGATDRDDPRGRLRLLDDNAKVYADIVPRTVAAAPGAILLVVTDPPDPLTDIAREAAGHERVFGTGTLIDSLRLRFHIGRRLGIDPRSIDAQVVGEHGKSSVVLWSSATIAGAPALELLAGGGSEADELKEEIEQEVADANITIIEGIGASQYGIGIVAARLVETVLGDERAVLPVGSYQRQYRTTLSLPTIIGRDGVLGVLQPKLSTEEAKSLERSAQILRDARAELA